MTYQFAASLLDAVAATVVEAGVTRLVEGTYYGVVVIDGPTGRHEVDARPSDALNLAVLAGAPIRVDAAILEDPQAVDRPAWKNYPRSSADLVAEMRRRQQEAFEKFTAERSSAADRPDG
jgi:bifunctional DNase/RNase